MEDIGNVMGITIGKQMPDVVGADVYDMSGKEHLGIIEFPVPILKGDADIIKTIREKLYEPEFSDLTVFGIEGLGEPFTVLQGALFGMSVAFEINFASKYIQRKNGACMVVQNQENEFYIVLFGCVLDAKSLDPLKLHMDY